MRTSTEYAAELNAITDRMNGGYSFKVVDLELDNPTLLEKLIDYYSDYDEEEDGE